MRTLQCLVKMWANLVFLSLTLVTGIICLQQEEDGTVTVRTEDGLLRGRVATSIWNRTYVSFQNIPYAQPPVGVLRFKSPQPVKPWTGVRDALESGPYCIQNRDTPGNISEDCLHLNVYMPQMASPPSGGLPVLVWIHGGAFLAGAASDGPDNLMNHSVIFVNVNYRLGALGFLSMEHPDVTSNAGMKDQVAALRWVKRNIAHFGGNPDDVTVSGQSAGGISVDMLLLSPMTTGLFKRAISQSGSALVVNFEPNYNATQAGYRLGRALGYNGTNTDDLVKFLRSATAEDILKGQELVAEEEGAGATELTSFPVIDAKIQEGKEIFLPDVPENMLRQGKAQPVPFIIGSTSEEANGFLKGVSQASLDDYNNNPELFIPASLNIKKGSAESLQLAAKIKSFYFGNKTVSYDTLQQLTDLLSDNFMIYPVHRSAIHHVNYGVSPVYMYIFTYEGSLKNHSGNTTVKGPGHGDDVNYLFVDYSPYKPSSDDLKVIGHLTGMWVDFAHSGDPSLHESVKWIPATKTNHVYLQLDADLSLHQNPLKERMAFWDQVYDTYKK